MPFRATFDCLWCGASHATRSPDDLEGWAQLCPACVGRAGDNGFLRFRLRSALEERGRARSAVGSAASDRASPMPALAAAPSDEWYLRRGSHSHGAIEDATWLADLDAATLWLDGLPLAGRIVELGAGSGWWSPLLAGKGELWAYESSRDDRDRLRRRLVAHGLRAHLHPWDPWSEPPDRADAVFGAFLLGRVPPRAAAPFLERARRWLRPGGVFAFIEALPGAERDAPTDPSRLEVALGDAGFTASELTTTSRFFVLGSARG